MTIASDEYQTPKKYIKAAIEVMGSIDLDPACSHINAERLRKVIPSLTYFTKEDNGLTTRWFGNVWLNEPYSKPNLTLFTNRIVNQYHSHTNIKQLVNLIPSYTSEGWYHTCIRYSSSICIPDHRICFLINGRLQTSPRFANTFFYFGNNHYEFMQVFSRFGKCYKN